MSDRTVRSRLGVLTQLVGSRGRAMLDRAGSGQVISGSAGGVFGSLDPAQDREIKADRAMADIIVQALGECFGDELKSVVIEGRKDSIQVSEGGRYEAFVDPLDNSQGCYATLKMPPALRRTSPHMFAATIAIFERPTDGSPMCYKHVVGSCVIALDGGTSFVYVRDEVDASKKVSDASDDELFVRKDGRAVGLNHTINVECYYSDMRDRLAKAFRGINGAFRSAGCAAMEQVHVATGAYAVFFCDTQKQHEPPATYGLVKAAGGVCFTIRGMSGSPDGWELVPLDEQPFDFNKKIPVLMAGNEGYAREVFDLLKRAGSA